jgi:hypothetical protein
MRNLIESARWRRFQCTEAPASQYASASASRYCLAENIGFAAIVMAELEFGKIQWQIFLAHVVVSPDNSALQQRPEAFDVIGMHFAAHVFVRLVIYGVVRESLMELLIASAFISRDQIDFLRNRQPYESAHRLHRRVLNDLASDIALARDRTNDGNLVDRAAPRLFLVPVAIAIQAADVGFIHFDNAHQLLELGVFHRGAQAMAHVPSRLVCTASDLALNLERADALLAVKDLPENLEPSLERILSVLKNRPADDAKAVVLAGLAEPVEWPRFQDINFVAIATRAMDNAISPAVIQHELFAGFVGRKGFHQFAERHHAL